MKSTLINMVAVLFGITLIASAGVGVVNSITAKHIEQANMLAAEEAIKAVLPQFDSVISAELTLDELPIVVYTATAKGQIIGYAIKTVSKNGFGGEIELMVGFEVDGVIRNVNVLKQNETPGLGTKMADDDNALINSLKGQNPSQITLKVKKDGGDVDALTAATISSRAYVDAIARAYTAYEQVVHTGTWSGQDSVSGATLEVQSDEQTAQKGDDNE